MGWNVPNKFITDKIDGLIVAKAVTESARHREIETSKLPSMVAVIVI